MKQLVFFLAFGVTGFVGIPGTGFTQEVKEGLVPPGWKLLLEAKGDLNGDGRDDRVLIIEALSRERFKPNAGLGPDTLNLNSRTLLVWFADDQGYELESSNDKGFIPAQNSEVNPCLADPLLDGKVKPAAEICLKIRRIGRIRAGVLSLSKSGMT